MCVRVCVCVCVAAGDIVLSLRTELEAEKKAHLEGEESGRLTDPAFADTLIPIDFRFIMTS